MVLLTGAIVSRQTAGLIDAARLARPMVETLLDGAIRS